MILIGIDTGVSTGVAVWDTATRQLLQVKCLMIHQAIELVEGFNARAKIKVYFEDARLRKWYGKNSNAKLQGAGSVKRDAKIWEDFLNDKGIESVAVAPAKGMTKMKAPAFKMLTKWDEQTNEHSRDAALLVYGRTN